MKTSFTPLSRTVIAGLLILILFSVSGCASGRSGSITVKEFKQYTLEALDHARAGNWPATQKYLDKLSRKGWPPDRLFTAGTDMLHKGYAQNRETGKKMKLYDRERPMGLIFIYLSALGNNFFAQSELGLLYGKKTKWLGKTNRIKSYYWFARALQNPQKNKAEPESLRYIEDILDSYRNGFKPRQMNLIRYYLETPDYIMPLLSGPRTFSK